MYYTEEEIKGAIERATSTITLITESCTEYTRGLNDCLALLAEYDLELRGETKARDIVDTPWNSTKEWLVKLARKGYSVKTFIEYCGYEIVANKKPKLGDIAFYEGGMINSGKFWISTNEDNSGVTNRMRVTFYESRIPIIARPVRT